jgi:hypothetical protein
MIDFTDMKVLNRLYICVLQIKLLMQDVNLSLYRDGPKKFQEVESLRFSRQSAHESGKVFSPPHRPPLPPGDSPGAHFC